MGRKCCRSRRSTSGPRQGEVRIRVKALGLNRAESMFRGASTSKQPKLPSRLGYEAAGTVEAVGPGVGLEVGDAVSTIPASQPKGYGVYGDMVWSRQRPS